jgi:hypothetical protein
MKVVVKVNDELEGMPEGYAGFCSFCNKKATYYLRKLGFKICAECKEKYCEEV